NYVERDGGERRTITVEGVSAWQVAISELRTALAGKAQVKSFTPTKDKLARASGWLSLVDAGKFYMVRGNWNDDFILELEDFPNGSHDDMIDAVSMLWFRMKKSGKTILV